MKQRDSIMGMAVVSVDGTQMDSQVFEDVQAIVLGNSYGVKQGDVVVAVGALPAFPTPVIMGLSPM